jgi:nitrous oxidase accessory protein
VTGSRHALARVLALALLARGAGAAPAERVSQAAPARPASCLAVAAGSSLDAAIAAAPEGASLCLAPGDYTGPVQVTRRLTLWGPREAVIRSQGSGTTVALDAAGSALQGLAVDGSGGRFDLLDAAVRVGADGVRVEGVAIRDALFGVLADRCRGLVLRGNEITGRPEVPLGLRGDGIRLWEVRDSQVESNRLADSRDMVVWYSPGNRIAHNSVLRGRYGTHFMYSHANVVEDNRYEQNVVGIFVMYSRDVVVRNNLVLRSAGAAGMGFGAKDSVGLVVEGNAFLGNRTGAYIDTSAFSPGEVNLFERNAFRLGEVGIELHAGAAVDRFVGNSFRDNDVEVAVEGRGDARAAEWRGNDWGDYAGYDLDGDGIGDLPYELRSLSSELAARVPALAFFRGAPAFWLVELIGRVVPLLEPQVLLVDPAPRMAALAPGIPDAD